MTISLCFAPIATRPAWPGSSHPGRSGQFVRKGPSNSSKAWSSASSGALVASVCAQASRASDRSQIIALGRGVAIAWPARALKGHRRPAEAVGVAAQWPGRTRARLLGWFELEQGF